MFYQIKSYFLFYLKSSNAHGVHSPFVYDLITKCFYDQELRSEYETLSTYRNHLLQQKGKIKIKDFGAGSRVFQTDERPLSAIVKNAGIPYKRQKLLFRLARYLNVKNALELGTSLGLATTALSLANPLIKIDTVEGCPETSEKADSLFSEFNLKNICLHTMTFEQFFSSESPSEAYDLIYIDGNHSKKGTLDNFKNLLNHIHSESVLIFDDIYWSLEMTEAWTEIKQDPQVKVSINCFHWGLIFFRKEQVKEHFTIRL